jgi:hypothetical protein
MQAERGIYFFFASRDDFAAAAQARGIKGEAFARC